MLGISSKVISSHDELTLFVSNYNQGTKKRKVEDLEGSFVRAFYLNDVMLGGYSVNVAAPYFHIEMIPPKERENIGVNNPYTKYTEIRSLWIKSISPNSLRAFIYCRSVLDAASTKPDYILGGTFTEPYRKTQMRALPRLLYHGDVNVWNREQVWWIFCGKPYECILRLPNAILGGWVDRLKR